MNQLLDLDAVAQADLVKQRKVSPLELVDAAIASAEALNPKLGAIATALFDEARKTARTAQLEGPFAGVPMVVKDLGATCAGAPHTECSRLLEGHIAEADSELVARFRRTGVVVIATSRASEFGIMPHADSALFGRCRNPWDLERSTGGSSGGSAALVAARVVALGHANDMGGSIRIPAACCGLFGMKPTRARTPLGPEFGDIASGLVQQLAVTRSVRDSAVLLDAVAGAAPGDPYAAPPIERPFAEEVGRAPGQLKIALTRQPLNGAPVDPHCLAAVDDAARLCSELGHVVVEAAPAVDDFEAVMNAFLLVCGAHVASTLDYSSRLAGRTLTPELVEPHTFALAAIGRGNTAADYLTALAALQRVSRRIAAFMSDHHVWLTPTLATPPLPIGALDSPPDSPLLGFFHAGAFAGFTIPCNITGQPAMSVPLYWNAAGLPIGVQFAARFGDEATLFRLAAQLESARPWTKRVPPLLG
jgi:amidase